MTPPVLVYYDQPVARGVQVSITMEGRGGEVLGLPLTASKDKKGEGMG